MGFQIIDLKYVDRPTSPDRLFGHEMADSWIPTPASGHHGASKRNRPKVLYCDLHRKMIVVPPIRRRVCHIMRMRRSSKLAVRSRRDSCEGQPLALV